MFPYTRYFLLIVASVFLAFSIAVSASPRVEVIATDLNRPWSIAWINETEVLISERSGQLIHLDLSSSERTAIGNVPSVTAVGQGGLLDVQVTTLGDTLWVYLALSGVHDDQTTGTEL
jgi:glucose/arabinose dehydrogenase